MHYGSTKQLFAGSLSQAHKQRRNSVGLSKSGGSEKGSGRPPAGSRGSPSRVWGRSLPETERL